MSWSEQAACRDLGPERHAIFFPRETQGAARAAYAEARAICAVCPVTEDCLAFVATFERQGIRVGMWGGTTPSQREARGDLRCACLVCGVMFTPESRYRVCSDECRAVARRSSVTASRKRTKENAPCPT